MMRVLALATISALLLSGIPPAPIDPLPAQSSARRPAPPIDADTICAPYLDNFESGMRYRSPAAGTARSGRTSAPPMPYAPPPPPPSMAAPEMSVSGSRIARPFDHALRDRERYAGEAVSNVLAVAEAPVSTFSVDVDTGSYANVRRMLNAGQMPPGAAVRTEEMLNYFRYDYPAPADRSRPFSVTTDMTLTPWNPDTRLLRIGLRGYDLPRAERPPANLVFLVDVSGSMFSRDKLPLVQCSLALLAEQLSPRDRVSIVTYAGWTGVALEPTSDRRRVLDALARLNAGGSTAGAAGLQLAYATARRAMIPDGINRIILATDGDFNVGVTSTDALIDMVTRERESGITLTTLGFGTGNYNEALMERIADHGNGNYAYIDSPREAQKVLADEMSSTLFTIAHDVKIQVEFNPAYVREYRLIGYENRALREEDFANDAVDAGEIGAGHQVTAIYEIVPFGAPGWLPERRYAANQRPDSPGNPQGELAHLRLRYKLPGETESRLIERPLAAGLVRAARAPSGDGAFAAAVAAYGQLLRGDTNMGRFTFADARALAEQGAGGNWWRREFMDLTRLAERQRFAGGGK
jgi:Ca-activated chloride channel family protein